LASAGQGYNEKEADEDLLNTITVNQLILLRGAVGLLGENAKPKWWSSAFGGPESETFLKPVFPRTHFLARLQGFSAAAAHVHDDRIGVGNVYHLFRLPEALEQELHQFGTSSAMRGIADELNDVEAATGVIKRIAGDTSKSAEGPVLAGPLSSVRDEAVWREVASHYLGAYQAGQAVFPFFADQA
jgi:hypothetical protein